jgi:hypothetical protein
MTVFRDQCFQEFGPWRTQVQIPCVINEGTLKTQIRSWKRKMRGVEKSIVIQLWFGIVATEGYFKFERVVSL